eukprot:1180045-Rhodomonas_salina.1
MKNSLFFTENRFSCSDNGSCAGDLSWLRWRSPALLSRVLPVPCFQAAGPVPHAEGRCVSV